jgi:hypothetical protein
MLGSWEALSRPHLPSSLHSPTRSTALVTTLGPHGQLHFLGWLMTDPPPARSPSEGGPWGKGAQAGAATPSYTHQYLGSPRKVVCVEGSAGPHSQRRKRLTQTKCGLRTLRPASGPAL